MNYLALGIRRQRNFGHGRSDVITLGIIDAELRDPPLYGTGMDEFGHRLHVELAGEVDDTLGEDGGVGVGVELPDQAAIDLDQVHLDPQQVFEIGITAAEIVYGYLAAQALEFFHEGIGLVVVLDDFGFQDLEHRATGQSVLLQPGLDEVRGFRVRDVLVSEIDGKFVGQVPERLEYLFYHQQGNGTVQPELPGYVQEPARRHHLAVLVQQSGQALEFFDLAGTVVVDRLKTGTNPSFLERCLETLGP